MITLAALACRGPAPAARDSLVADASSRTAMTNPFSDSLDVSLILPRSPRRGEPIPITFRARNRTARPLDLYLRGRTPTLDVLIARRRTQVVWRRLEGEIIPAILHLRTLAPGEALEVETSWDQRTKADLLEPGEYTAQGLLLAEGEPLESPVVGFQVAGAEAE